MECVIPVELSAMLSQSQAAALAVLVADIRRHGEANSDESSGTRECNAWLQEIEAVACASIAKNDGNVVHWIGVAAKQMSLLLG